MASAFLSQGLYQLPGLCGQSSKELICCRKTGTSNVGLFQVSFYLVCGQSSEHGKMNACCQRMCHHSRHGQRSCLQEHSEWLLWARYQGVGASAGRKPVNCLLDDKGGAGLSQLRIRGVQKVFSGKWKVPAHSWRLWRSLTGRGTCREVLYPRDEGGGVWREHTQACKACAYLEHCKCSPGSSL